MEISAGFIIFLVLVSPFVLWIISFFTGLAIAIIRLLLKKFRKNGGTV
jgi:hypothetical protein